VVLQKAAEKTTEAIRSGSTAASVGLENLVARAAGIEQFRSLDSISVPSLKSVSPSSRPLLGPTGIPSQLPFFAQSSVGTNVRAPSLLTSTYGITDSAALAVASQKLSLPSKGKPLTVSLIQHEPRTCSVSSAPVVPSIQHQLVAGSQSAAFGLINSQLRKAADSGLAAVLVAPPASSSSAAAVRSVATSMPPHTAFPLPHARHVLPPASSANIGLSTVNSPSVTFASSVPPFNSASKPVVARLMAQQRLPGVLALSGMPLFIASCNIMVYRALLPLPMLLNKKEWFFRGYSI